MTQEQIEAKVLALHLESQGLEGVYGGGSQAKGHGFWFRKNGVTVQNNGRHSGNPDFWLCTNLLLFLTCPGAKCPCGLPANSGLYCSEACAELGQVVGADDA
jgi:hypothetical protein